LIGIGKKIGALEKDRENSTNSKPSWCRKVTAVIEFAPPSTLGMVGCPVFPRGVVITVERCEMIPSSDAQDTAQNCYTMAYFLLPQYVSREGATFVENLSRSATLGAGFYYVMACSMNAKEPDMNLIRSFPVHLGDLDAVHRYCIVQYPSPPAVDLSELSLDEMLQMADKVVLAPYFSAIVLNKQSNEVRYFILGQSPDGFTTLRGVTPELNANLGPGCEPELDEFVALLREKLVEPG
jgi:hypothetical protein